MKLGEQIKILRAEQNLSQEELAEKVFVSRQSISNWENGKTYPDIKSLLLLSEVFSVSLDTLIKGDVETMKMEINAQEQMAFQRDSWIYTILLILLALTPIPLIHFMGLWGAAVYLAQAVITVAFAFKVEKFKKKHDIYTYKEIIAFAEGKQMNQIDKAREEGKRPYQRIMLAVGCAATTFDICLLIDLLFTKLF